MEGVLKEKKERWFEEELLKIRLLKNESEVWKFIREVDGNYRNKCGLGVNVWKAYCMELLQAEGGPVVLKETDKGKTLDNQKEITEEEVRSAIESVKAK